MNVHVAAVLDTAATYLAGPTAARKTALRDALEALALSENEPWPEPPEDQFAVQVFDGAGVSRVTTPADLTTSRRMLGGLNGGPRRRLLKVTYTVAEEE